MVVTISFTCTHSLPSTSSRLQGSRFGAQQVQCMMLTWTLTHGLWPTRSILTSMIGKHQAMAAPLGCPLTAPTTTSPGHAPSATSCLACLRQEASQSRQIDDKNRMCKRSPGFVGACCCVTSLGVLCKPRPEAQLPETPTKDNRQCRVHSIKPQADINLSSSDSETPWVA